MKKIIHQKYEVVSLLGQGQFGSVYKAVNMITEEVFAIKEIPKEFFKEIPMLVGMLESEIKVLLSIRHVNIIRLFDVFQSQNNMYFLYECCNGGTLEELINEAKNLSEKEAMHIFRQLLAGFNQLEKLHVIHRDIKPANILFHNSIPKIADLGFCKFIRESTSSYVGSPAYMAPEVKESRLYDLKADVYSLGITLCEMLFGIIPFDRGEDRNSGNNEGPALNQTVYLPVLINPLKKETEFLIRRMLVKAPEKRMSWEELFRFDFGYLEEEKEEIESPKRKSGKDGGERENQSVFSPSNHKSPREKIEKVEEINEIIAVFFSLPEIYKDLRTRVRSSWMAQKVFSKDELETLKTMKFVELAIQAAEIMKEISLFEELLPKAFQSICQVVSTFEGNMEAFSESQKQKTPENTTNTLNTRSLHGESESDCMKAVSAKQFRKELLLATRYIHLKGSPSSSAQFNLEGQLISILCDLATFDRSFLFYNLLLPSNGQNNYWEQFANHPGISNGDLQKFITLKIQSL